MSIIERFRAEVEKAIVAEINHPRHAGDTWYGERVGMNLARLILNHKAAEHAASYAGQEGWLPNVRRNGVTGRRDGHRRCA